MTLEPSITFEITRIITDRATIKADNMGNRFPEDIGVCYGGCVEFFYT